MEPKNVFKAHPNLKSYFQTSDGVKFFTAHDAKTHARSLDDKSVEEVKRGSSKDNKTAKSKPEPSSFEKAKLRIDAIGALETVEEVEKALEGETAKTVREAGEKRIEAINALTKKGE